MKIGLIAMIFIGSILNTAFCQQRQTVFSVDSRVGYSSNTYLNPYFSEWDRSLASGFGVVSIFGQGAWFDQKNVLEMTGGAVFEPFFKQRDAWKGGLGLINYQRKFSGKISGGFEAGASYFTSSFDRTLLWAQPALTWLPSPFTQVKVKAGSNYRVYKNFQVDSVATDSKNRVDLYALELETWPDFHWKLTAGLYGSLGSLPAVQEGFSSLVSAGYLFNTGERIKLKIGWEQYQNEQSTTTPGGGGIGGLPIGGGPSGSTETITETDRMFRLGLEGRVPIGKLLSVFVNLEGLQYYSSTTGEKVRDYQVSGGLRLTVQPQTGNPSGTINPDWEKIENRDRLLVEIRHTGEGQLYIVGDFNDWERPGIPLVNRGRSRYVAELRLTTGAYEYKVLNVNEEEEHWLKFSEDTYTVDDGFGGENALLLID